MNYLTILRTNCNNFFRLYLAWLIADDGLFEHELSLALDRVLLALEEGGHV